MAEEEAPRGNAAVQEFMTAYLYGIYTFKGGYLTPDEAIRHVLDFAALAEKAGGFSTRLMAMIKK